MRFRARWLGFLVLVPLVFALAAAVVMHLWNWLAPELFMGAHSIDFMHAAGLLVLARLLFGRWHGGPGWHMRRHWRRWESMSPEEREQFGQLMQHRHGHCHGGRHRGRDEPTAPAPTTAGNGA